jgi:hypothetical protein
MQKLVSPTIHKFSKLVLSDAQFYSCGILLQKLLKIDPKKRTRHLRPLTWWALFRHWRTTSGGKWLLRWKGNGLRFGVI